MTEVGAGLAAAVGQQQLGDVPVDEVLGVLDRPRSDYRQLYYRWEAEQWEAGAVDLTEDRLGWNELPPAARTGFVRGLSPLSAGEGRFTTALVPFVDAAPGEEQQVFLTTQLADHARHLVFVDRYLKEVMVEDFDLGSRPRAEDADLHPALASLLLERLPELTARIGADRDQGALVEGIVLYHLIFEGVVVLTTQRFLLNHARDENILPGFRQGMTAVVRDLTRHVGFATTLLHDTVRTEQRHEAVVRGALDRFLPLGLEALHPSEGEEELPGLAADDRSAYARRWLGRRLDQIGVKRPN